MPLFGTQMLPWPGWGRSLLLWGAGDGLHSIPDPLQWQRKSDCFARTCNLTQCKADWGTVLFAQRTWHRRLQRHKTCV